MTEEHKEVPGTTAPTQDYSEYWKANIRIILISLVIWAVCSLGIAVLFRPAFMNITFMNTDIGFWFGQQGSILTFIALIFFYTWYMNRLDKKFGVAED